MQKIAVLVDEDDGGMCVVHCVLVLSNTNKEPNKIRYRYYMVDPRTDRAVQVCDCYYVCNSGLQSLLDKEGLEYFIPEIFHSLYCEDFADELLRTGNYTVIY